MGFSRVERMSGGIDEWTLGGRHLEVEGKARVDDLVLAGAEVVDVRSAAEYAIEHIAGARNAPSGELVADPVAAMPWVGLSTNVLIYGAGGPDASLSRAAEALEGAGFFAVGLYSGGIADWKAGGGGTE